MCGSFCRGVILLVAVDAQKGMFDLDLSEESDLRERAEEIWDLTNRIGPEMIELRRKKKAFAEALAGYYSQLVESVGADEYEEVGARVRIGRFVQKVGKRRGGGYTIEEWEAGAAMMGQLKLMNQ